MSVISTYLIFLRFSNFNRFIKKYVQLNVKFKTKHSLSFQRSTKMPPLELLNSIYGNVCIIGPHFFCTIPITEAERSFSKLGKKLAKVENK